ncbi:MAG: GyrI-like domain-containing protein [Bdellovibrionales bacterium]|nr:GyrI-like domain-containing protein [Bdellovibrionales bacterium]
MKIIIAFTVCALLGFLATVAIYLGAFKEVHIEKTYVPNLHLIYKLHTGAYHKIGKSIEEVEKWAKEKGLNCDISFGEYFMDPKSVDESLLRSHAGCVTKDTYEGELPNEWNQRDLEESPALLAHFDGSPAIGPYKVYPKVNEYLKQQGLGEYQSVFEIYSLVNDHFSTQYYFLLKGYHYEKN